MPDYIVTLKQVYKIKVKNALTKQSAKEEAAKLLPKFHDHYFQGTEVKVKRDREKN